ncbi:ATP-dependent DNA helicase [Pseudomonas sp. RIT-PI-S]|uniref:ATP-dependent DNA helicase n=1 Tax=Pseudomonas sp. RIT-PI-S TaxID=3035295 RepID=UPI0021DB1E21|nr:ATP-dependent DNA helicase [Pseudomonas sp. RIT-PI-S]
MTLTVAVRALCEFTAREGDLDLRFTPSPSALEGMAGHRKVSDRRGPTYRREISLAGEHKGLQVRGRADGFDPERQCLEEVKTHRGDLKRQPANQRALHWAQAKVYASLLCEEQGLPRVKVALVYWNVDSESETRFEADHGADALQAFFHAQCEAFLDWAARERAHLQRRDGFLQALAFPHEAMRPGQRQLAETVYKAASMGRAVLAQAPTGIGKTLGTLFPLLKAMPRQQLQRILFLTAKTPGRRLALDALQQLQPEPVQGEPQPLRVLELTAREKACEYPGTACHGDACPLARGFYDRLPAARVAAAERGWLDRAALRELALAHQVCPYYLSQEMARWADVIIGDYNYYFDLSGWLFALAQAQEWRFAVLVDEAHNLVERARGMYSASLDQRLLATLREAPLAGASNALRTLGRHWSALAKAQGEGYHSQPGLPAQWLAALQRCMSIVSDQLNQDPAAVAPQWLDFYFQALQFTRVAELFSDAFVFDLEVYPARRGLRARLNLRNVVPAPLLTPRFKSARSCVLFSATLSPAHYFADLLGLPDGWAWLDVPSPFRASQLHVRLAAQVSTRYADRQQSLASVARIIAEQYQRRPGNYLAFFSSFDYLGQVAERLAASCPEVPLRCQRRAMDEGERQAFIDGFTADGCGIGFAVLGGAFGEGIDLPGARLIGAFVATLGMAQVNPVNENFKRRMQARFGSGHDYVYLFPGLHKVVQAAGRVIRHEADQGTIVLIDDRYAQPQVQRLLPGWWPAAEPVAG